MVSVRLSGASRGCIERMRWEGVLGGCIERVCVCVLGGGGGGAVCTVSMRGLGARVGHEERTCRGVLPSPLRFSIISGYFAHKKRIFPGQQKQTTGGGSKGKVT